MKEKLLVALLLPIFYCASCNESPNMKKILYVDIDSVGNQKRRIEFDFNGELANDSSFSRDYVFCRQQQCKDLDIYYAVFPESNYVGLNRGELEIRLFQHQKYKPSGIDVSASPLVALGRIRKQKFSGVCGGLQISLKGHGTVTALRFTDNDSLDKLWGNYVVRHLGEENQQLFALSSSDGDNEVWLDSPDGITLSEDTAKAFTVMLPAGAFYRGFALDVFGCDSLLYHIATESNCKIRRGKTIKMPEIIIP